MFLLQLKICCTSGQRKIIVLIRSEKNGHHCNNVTRALLHLILLQRWRFSESLKGLSIILIRVPSKVFKGILLKDWNFSGVFTEV